MITLEQATETFRQMVEKTEPKHTIEKVWEIMLEEPIYAMIAIDEGGNQVFPGEVFPSIRKKDGMIVNFTFPATG